MSFVDKVSVTVIAGNGGNGKLSFRHERGVSRGGPDGGDGGDGGDVILQASRNQNTLAAFRYQKELKADVGLQGGPSRKHGRSSKPFIVAIPVGTVVSRISDQKMVADLVEDGQEAIVAKGGKGGFGNAHFVSSVRQAPNFAEKGEPGETFELQLELKMIADVGLVGLPNAGKSTLLAKISNAKPEIANYAFTTLTPNLGVVDIDKNNSILFADIPGLIEGAAEGKGLGHDFLRHVERTAVIVHLIDAYNPDIVAAYQTIRDELKAYKADLADRTEIIAINKVEGLDSEIVNDLMASLKRVASKKAQIMAISAQAGIGMKDLLFAVNKEVQNYRNKVEIIKKKRPQIPVLTITNRQDEWHVDREGDIFMVTGPKIERFARRTDFESEEAVQRLRDIMRREGIMHELRRQNIEPGQAVQFSHHGQFTY